MMVLIPLFFSAQTWTKLDGITDSVSISIANGIAQTNNNIVIRGNNLSNQLTYLLSTDGNIWSEIPDLNDGGYVLNSLPQNNLIISSGFESNTASSFSKKLFENEWQTFNNYIYAYAEFGDGTIIGGRAGFEDALYLFSTDGLRGEPLGEYAYGMGSRYCLGNSNRLFLFNYTVAGYPLVFIDRDNLSVLNYPSTLDGSAIDQSNSTMKSITSMVKLSNGNLFATYSSGGGLIKSTDNGISWVTLNVPNLTSSGLKLVKNSLDELFILAAYKILKSSDFGVTTTDITGNLGFPLAYEIFINENDELFCFVGPSLWKFASTNSTSYGASNLDKFTIYPNPSNSNVNIELDGVEDYSSTVTVTNTLGQIIHSQKLKKSGNTFNVSQFEKGVYFVSLNARNNISTQKLIIN